MHTKAKFVSKTKIDENLYEIKHDLFHTGSCQCFKDCDCINQKGQYLGSDIRYSNDIVLREDNKPRIYSTKEGCLESLKAYFNKIKIINHDC